MPAPNWDVYDPDEGDETDAKQIQAWDAEDAAKEYAEDKDNESGEGWRDRREVRVSKSGANKWVKVVVYAEPDVTYSARQVEDSSPEDTTDAV